MKYETLIGYAVGIVVALILVVEYQYSPALSIITTGIFIGRLIAKTSN